jgi:hypothetical protein
MIVPSFKPNRMSSEIIFEISESAEGGYEAKALGYSIYTQADTPEELKQMLKDALTVILQTTQKDLV